MVCEWTLGISLSLPTSLSKKIIDVKRDLHLEYWGNYTIKPHITIYLCAFDPENFNVLVNNIQNLKIKHLEIILSGPSFNKHGAKGDFFYKIGIETNQKLIDLHKQILEISNIFRNNAIRIKDKERIVQGKYSLEDQNLIEKYGYSRVLENYESHITLGEINTIQQKIIGDTILEKFTFTKEEKVNLKSITIGIYKQDIESGQWIEKKEQKIILK